MSSQTQTPSEQSQVIPEWTLGDRLRKCRETTDLSVSEMALKLGVSRQTIRNWESDRVEPRVSVMRAYAEMANVPAAWLLENTRSSLLVTSNKTGSKFRDSDKTRPGNNRPGGVSPTRTPLAPPPPVSSQAA